MKAKLIMVGVIAFICALGVLYDTVFTARSLSRKPYIEASKSILDPSTWDKIPPITLTGLDGKNFSITDYKGKVLILNFWATWCPACKTEFPSLLKLVRNSNGKVTLISVSIDESKENIQKFLDGLKADYGPELAGSQVQMAWDSDRSVVTGMFETLLVPEAIILTRDQRMARKVVGPYDWQSSELIDFINQIMESQA